VMNSVVNGDIDAETAKDLLTNILPKSKEQKSLLADPIITRFEKSIRDVITKNELSDNFADQRAFRSSEATSAFLRGMIEFKQTKPDANQLEFLKYAKDFQKEILEIYREDDSEPLPNVDLEQSDPTKNALFRDAAALDQAIDEYNATQGSSGKLKAIAQQYQMDPTSLINAQKKLFKPKP
jgi:hypothetical protein